MTLDLHTPVVLRLMLWSDNSAQEIVKLKVDAWFSNVRCLFCNSKMNVSSVFPWLAAMGTMMLVIYTI
ncbi:MAG TPA: hypothetical protein VIK56_09700 [Rhodoferax sp.]